MHWTARLPLLAAALWWGSLSLLGFVVVPLLFRHAPSAAVAGQLAGKLFAAQAWLSLGCGVALLAAARARAGVAGMGWAGGALGFVLLGMLAALLQEFAIAPRILARQELAFWHRAGTAAYAVQWLCALVVLWKLAGGAAAAAAQPGGTVRSDRTAAGG